MAGCLGGEAEKTGKGTGRERIWHSAQRQRNLNGDSLKLSPRLLARKGFVPKRPCWASQKRTLVASS